MDFILCEDSAEDRALLKGYIAKHASASFFEYTVREYVSAEALLADYDSFSGGPCILFLDIYTGGMTGMEAALAIVKFGFSGSIIFTTVSADYAIDGYLVAADGYLKKPFTYEEFLLSVHRSYNRIDAALRTLVVTTDHVRLPIYLKDILYIETGKHCCYIALNEEKIKTGLPIVALEQELKREVGFLRCHRSYIVNLNKIGQVENDCFIMKNGDRVLYSIRDKAKTKKYITNYFWAQTRSVLED